MTAPLSPVEALQREIDSAKSLPFTCDAESVHVAALELAKAAANDMENLPLEVLVALNKLISEVRR